MVMAKVTFNCEWCGKEKKQYPSQYNKRTHHFCSLSCGISWRNTHLYNPSHERDISGDKNPMYGKGYLVSGARNGMFGKRNELCPAWKGGRLQRKDGYWRVNIDGNRVLEHRLVMQQAKVDITGKVVHHKNGNKSDNRLENLEAITQSEHINAHRAELCNSRLGKYK